MDESDIERRVKDLEKAFAVIHKQVGQLGKICATQQHSIETLAKPIMESARVAPLSTSN